MITISRYRNLMAAEVAKTRLESLGIRTMIADEFSYTLGYGSVIDGVRLQVAEEDAERAAEIMAAGEQIGLSDGSTGIADSPETEPAAAGALKESPEGSSAACTGRAHLLLILSGIFCLAIGRAAGDPRIMSPHSGHVILIGEILIVAGLWILYGRLKSDGGREVPPD